MNDNTTQDTELIINNPSKLVDSWKQRLTDDDILFCQSILGNYMKLFGYELSSNSIIQFNKFMKSIILLIKCIKTF